MYELTIIGGGLAGCEAAWQAATRGVAVTLYEMRPQVQTGAHTGGLLAELVCSNSLGSSLANRASGLVKEELRLMNSLLLDCAEANQVPAGAALAVDRNAFAEMVTQRISNHPNINIVRREAMSIPKTAAVIASGPLTSPTLAESIRSLSGQDSLFFFDAIAPIVTLDSINMEIAFRASRRQADDEVGDYINCPFDKEQYQQFVMALKSAERISLKSFENEIGSGVKAGVKTYFERCLPVEVLAGRDDNALAFGPMRPVGLHDPRTNKRYRAILQLRQDNLAGTLYNLVGFQTNLTYSEQERVFRMVPGLENAEFVRFGQMHRNTFIASPSLLEPTLQYRQRKDLFFAGQVCGVEGYMGNIMTGWLAGVNAARFLNQRPLLEFPLTTMSGALCHYIACAELRDFQPMKANFGILPPAETVIKSKIERANYASKRAIEDMVAYLNTIPEK